MLNIKTWLNLSSLTLYHFKENLEVYNILLCTYSNLI